MTGKLTPKQIKFLTELFRSSSVGEAIEKADVSKSTAYRWMRENVEFKKEFQHRKTLALENISTEMQIGFSDAVQELMLIIRDCDVSAQVKINAIDCLFRNARPIMEEVDFLNRLQEVETRIQEEGEFIESED